MKTERNETASGSTVGDGGEPYIDKAEVSRRLHMKLRTVDAWMRRGLLPYYKMGHVVRFKWSEIEVHLAKQCRVCRELTKAGI